jgi:uncharacterized membrane protein YfcA|tara:strand:+ start:4776 stop:5534 length:759 start_codon:yes stop_codon:yes gene_type:complete
MQVISNIDHLILIQVILIFLAGGAVKGLIGVGLPTVTLTLLSFIFDIKESISIILLPVIITNLYQMLNGKHLKQIIDDTKIFQISAVPTVFLGFYFLLLLKSDTILLILAIVLIYNSFLGLLKYEIKFKNYKSKYYQILIGGLTGTVTGISGIYTMPFIFLLQSLQYSKNKAIQLMGLTFFLFACTQFLLFILYDLISFKILALSSIACIPILLGVYLGTVLRRNISENIFKMLFNLMLVFMGILLIIKTIF